MSEREKPPIFIVGCPRSGTSLLRLCLDSHPSISCGQETHFLRDMERIVRSHWYHVQQYGFPREYWLKAIGSFFSTFQQDYARKRNKSRWADKTPSYTVYMPFLSDLFPDCQFLHIVRDCRDVVLSHRDRWGYKRATKSVAKWRQYVSEARAFGGTLPPTRYLELRYETLVRETEPTLRKVLEFLEEPWDDAVLNYLEAPHDRAPHQEILQQKRRQTEGDGNVVYASRIGVGAQRLDPFLKLLINLQARDLQKELGYT